MLAILRSLLQYIFRTLASSIGLVVFLLLIGYLVARLYGIDLDPYFLQAGRWLSGGRLVDFQQVFVHSVNPEMRVCEVQRVDTDNDGFNEWLVFYQFDTANPKDWRKPCPDNSPRAAVIYDNDRGKPAVLFPYKLQPPDSDYLGEYGVSFDQQEIVPNFGASTTDPIKELLFYGSGAAQRLTIFKYQSNSEPWAAPTDVTPRYQLIGAFKGTGGVQYNPKTRQVTVFDRGPFERSQLAIKTVYRLHGEGNEQTYMTEIGATALAAPVQSTIDFGTNPPLDIQNTAFPEKILLAFYEALTNSRDWQPQDFVAVGSAAEMHLKEKDLKYFGFGEEGSPSALAVTDLKYYPYAEQSINNPTTGNAPFVGQVAISASATQNGKRVSTGLITFQLVQVEGQWKVNKKLN